MQGKNGKNTTSAFRRFSDFLWLREILFKYEGFIIPFLPEKSFFANLNIENQNFKAARLKFLQQFTIKILQHEKLRYTQEVSN